MYITGCMCDVCRIVRWDYTPLLSLSPCVPLGSKQDQRGSKGKVVVLMHYPTSTGHIHIVVIVYGEQSTAQINYIGLSITR